MTMAAQPHHPGRRKALPRSSLALVIALGCLALAPPAGLARASAGAPGAPPDEPGPTRPILAVTLDDLPFVGGLGPGDSRPAAMGRIIAALRKHSAPATGFVVCERMDDGAAVLELWLAAGLDVGNHSTTHAHIDAVTLADWRGDVCGCGERLAAQTGAPVRWFRYPFLQMGATVALRDSALAIVRGCGHEVAHVSVDTGEWALVKPYVDALQARDTARARAVGEAYVDHVLTAIGHYRDVARARAGRDVGQVLLLHANALAADWLDELLKAVEGCGWRFVSLTEALADPIYQLPDDYAGPIGLSWLYRFAPAANASWAWDDEQVRMMQEEFGR